MTHQVKTGEAMRKRLAYAPFVDRFVKGLPNGNNVLICKDVLKTINEDIRKCNIDCMLTQDPIEPMTMIILTKMIASVFIRNRSVYVGELNDERRLWLEKNIYLR